MLERRFGIGAYDYRWGYTIAQIELGILDAPLVNYKKDKKKGEKNYKKEDLDNLALAWEKKRKGKSFAGKTFTVDNLFEDDVK